MPGSVFIVTGESSGEIYGARLARELRSRRPDMRLMGVGGKRMREAGVEMVAGITSAIGLFEVLMSLKKIKAELDSTVDAIAKERPDVLVLIDYPDFNFRVARRVRALGIKILYYVTPQVWAWRKGRVRDMAGFVDRAAVILPFEEDYLKSAGIHAEFVGHPIAEEMEDSIIDKAGAKARLGLEPQKPYVALLPGSRNAELQRLLPVLLETFKEFKKTCPEYGVLLSIAPNIDQSKYSETIAAFGEHGAVVTRDDISLLYAASEAAIVASGTAAFQAVFTATPLAVIYKVSALTYFIMRRLVDLEFVNLANLILKREAVREIIQSDATADTICEELVTLVSDKEKISRIRDDLMSVKKLFEGRSPTKRVADIISGMAGWAA